MLKDSQMLPTIPARDLDRARSWYADKLGLTPDHEPPDALLYRVGGDGWFLLFSSSGAGSVLHQVAAWRVEDLEAESPQCAAAAWPSRSTTRPSSGRSTESPPRPSAGRVVQGQRGQRAHDRAARLSGKPRESPCTARGDCTRYREVVRPRSAVAGDCGGDAEVAALSGRGRPGLPLPRRKGNARARKTRRRIVTLR